MNTFELSTGEAGGQPFSLVVIDLGVLPLRYVPILHFTQLWPDRLSSLAAKFYSFVRTGGSDLSLVEPQLIFTSHLPGPHLRSLNFPNEEVHLRLGMFTIRNDTDELSPSPRHCTTHLEPLLLA